MAQFPLDKIPGLLKDSDRLEHREERFNSHPQADRSLTIGMVIDCWVHLHQYLVSVPIGVPVMATAVTDGTSVHGYRSHAMYVPGTRVIMARPEASGPYYIVGALPTEVANYQLNSPGWVLEGDRTTLKDDPAHHIALNLTNSGGLKNYNLARPYDTYPGDLGWFNALEMGINLSLTSVMMRATDLAGLYMFYLDHLVRLNAYNFQLWTAARDEWSGEDEGESSEILRLSPYPWEMRGMRSAGTSIALGEPDEAREEWAKDQGPAYELKHADQTGIYRLHRYRGFLGDLERTIISTPSTAVTDHTRLSDPQEHIGLSETTRHSNGLLEFRSLKGILLEKAVHIPVPNQVRLQDDPAGDNSADDNYKFAGQFGTADEHDKTEFEFTSEETGVQMQLYEFLSYLHEDYGLQSFHRHTLDWQVPVEKDSQVHGAGTLDSAGFQPAGREFYSTLPTPFSIEIDHRTGHSGRYYKRRSIFWLADNGAILLEDGWGSQIEMLGGNIKITCANDVQLMPGRNVLAMAPHDLLLRSGNSVDITAAKKDVRIKAQQNFHCLAGNDRDQTGAEITGQGGILLETRSAGTRQSFDSVGESVISSGIILKARDSQILSYGKGVYLRAMDRGNVIIDADAGRGSYHVYANDQLTILENGRTVLYGTNPRTRQEPRGYEIANSSYTVFGQTSSVVFHTPNVMQTQGQMIVNGGFTAREVSSRSGGELGAWSPRTQEQINSSISAWDKITSAESTRARQAPAANSEMPYNEGGPGHDQLVNSIGFSLRSDEQYAVSSLIICESRWQQFFRVYESGDTVWDEPQVYSPTDVPTAPYPGIAAWYESENYRIQDEFVHWHAADGDVPGIHDTHQAGAPATRTLKDGYLINLQAT